MWLSRNMCINFFSKFWGSPMYTLLTTYTVGIRKIEERIRIRWLQRSEPGLSVFFAPENSFHKNLRLLLEWRNFISWEKFYIHKFHIIVGINFTRFLSKFLVFPLFRSIENFLIIPYTQIAFKSTWNSASIDLIFIGVLRLDFE